MNARRRHGLRQSGGKQWRRPRSLFIAAALVVGWFLLIACVTGVHAEKTLVVSPNGPYTSPAEALADAAPGDTIEVHGGTYAGPLLVDRSVQLVGHDWPAIDGGNAGTVVKIAAADVELRGFVIRNSGDSLDEENSGIAVEAPNAIIENNRLAGTLFGVYLREAPGSLIRGNVIESKDLPVPRRGDAIRVWYSNGVQIVDNRVDRGRDVVLWYSEHLTVRDNVVTNGRYGLHFMYCDDALVEHNQLGNNSVGAFLMYSRRLHLHENTIFGNRGPSGYGVGLKDLDDAVLERNLFVDNRIGAFVDNSPREIDSTVRYDGNVFAYNDFGVSLMPSVRRNQFAGNSFIENQEQVNQAGGGVLRDNVWTVEGRGNYWSDYAGYDADGDGLGDVAYRSQRLFENLMDQHAELRLFIYSPAAYAVDFAARALPFVAPQPKLTDDAPLMAPIVPENAPVPAQQNGRSLGVASLALLGLAATLLFAAPRLHLPTGRTVDADGPIVESEEIPMIHVTNLTKRFGRLQALNDVSFDVAAGQSVALWGANGAGKTTALRCLLGLLPYDGTVRVAGYNVSLHGKAVRRRIGFVPQELSFHNDLTVRETMRFYARLKKVSDGPIVPLLARVGLAAHGTKRVEELSGGMKQRLALAVALLADPPVLMLDEPTANLDARARDDFLHLLAELRDAGKTLVFSSHRLDEVFTLADRILVLENGRLTADCAPDEVGAMLGLEARLTLYVPIEMIEAAVSTLAAGGFDTSRNGRGVYVHVAAQEKGGPIQALVDAGIPVHDFQVEHARTAADGT